MCNQIDTGQQQGQSHPEHDYTDTDNRIEQNEKRGNNHENTQRHRPAGALDTHTHHLAGDADGHESPEEEPKAEHERQDREEHRRGAQQQDTQQDFDYTACDVPSDAPEDYIVRGPNRITALPMEVPVCYQEIAHCLEKSIAKIETAILSALENTPPELYADIVSNGIYLAGGGALLRGLDKRLTDKINIPFHIAEDPLLSVAKGTGIALKNVDRFSFLMR